MLVCVFSLANDHWLNTCTAHPECFPSLATTTTVCITPQTPTPPPNATVSHYSFAGARQTYNHRQLLKNLDANKQKQKQK